MGEGSVRTEEFSISGDEAVAKVKEIVQEGNVRRLILKTEEGNTLIEVPLTVGVGVAAGVVLLVPVLAAIGALAAVATDLTIVDPPCLRSIDTRIQDDALHFFVYFRSWDLWGGLPANLAGIQNLKEYMAGEIGVADGEMIVESKGLHLYGYAEDLAKLRCLRD